MPKRKPLTCLQLLRARIGRGVTVQIPGKCYQVQSDRVYGPDSLTYYSLRNIREIAGVFGFEVEDFTDYSPGYLRTVIIRKPFTRKDMKYV